MNYYKNELGILKDSEYNKNIIVSDGLGNKTKTLGVNLESIDELIKFLKNEKRKLKRKVK